jgi:hypothetical protein
VNYEHFFNSDKILAHLVKNVAEIFVFSVKSFLEHPVFFLNLI